MVEHSAVVRHTTVPAVPVHEHARPARAAGAQPGQQVGRRSSTSTASNRCATARVQVTETASGLNTGLPKRLAGLSAADSSEPTGTAAFRRSNWGSVKTISIIGTGVGRWEL